MVLWLWELNINWYSVVGVFNNNNKLEVHEQYDGAPAVLLLPELAAPAAIACFEFSAWPCADPVAAEAAAAAATVGAAVDFTLPIFFW